MWVNFFNNLVLRSVENQCSILLLLLLCIFQLPIQLRHEAKWDANPSQGKLTPYWQFGEATPKYMSLYCRRKAEQDGDSMQEGWGGGRSQTPNSGGVKQRSYPLWHCAALMVKLIKNYIIIVQPNPQSHPYTQTCLKRGLKNIDRQKVQRPCMVNWCNPPLSLAAL